MKRWISTSRNLAVSMILLWNAVPSSAQKILAPGLTSSGQANAGSAAPRSIYLETDPGARKRSWRYRINPSDALDLTFTLTPEFNQTVTVQPDGYITLRGVGDLPAAGSTLPELTESIKAAYSKILRDPEISVDAKDFEKPCFTVGGQVGRPGKFDWRGDVTLTQAIAMAGGFTDASKHSQVLLFRRVSDQWTEARIINVKKMLNSRDLQEDPRLQPGDMLFVPKNALSKVKPFLPTTTAGIYASPPIL
jgi:polysaccharide export outer membrane protein